MIPTADDIARAIVAAANETGADPIAVAEGKADKYRGRHASADRPYPISRARAYAAKALAAVFTDCWRTRIAGFVGARGLTRQSYFSALDQRLRDPAGGEWWDTAVLARVVAAVQAGMPESVKLPAPVVKSKAAPSYRPSAGTVEKILADDGDDGPVFDAGGLGAGFKRREPYPRASKRQMEEDLRAAVQRTAAMQRPEDD